MVVTQGISWRSRKNLPTDFLKWTVFGIYQIEGWTIFFTKEVYGCKSLLFPQSYITALWHLIINLTYGSDDHSGIQFKVGKNLL